MTQNFLTRTQAETEAVGAALAEKLRGGELIAFRGGLGVGKTAMIRGLLHALGYKGEVPSPTFAIVNEYRGGRLDAAHFDVYRITAPDELYHTGFYDYLDGKTVILIEWSENIEEEIAREKRIVVTIDGRAEQPRHIRIEEVDKS